MKFPRYLTMLLLLLAGSSLLQGPMAQVNFSAPIPLDPQVVTGKLDNGLTYFIRKNGKPKQKVELRLVLNAGSICEDDDQQGLAHMCEHMAFNGTTHFKKNEIVSFLQDIGVEFGGDLNAYTSFDETVYILPIPTDKPGNLEKGFQILEDWAHNVTYLDEDIDSERPIILEESRLGKGANDRMFRKVYPKLFEGSKYAERLPIGKDSLIKSFPYDAIRRFYKEWYRPDLMAVIVVGDIEPAVAEKMIRQHFAALKNPVNERPREMAKVYPYKNTEAMLVTDKEATGYSVAINYPYYKVSQEKTLADYRRELLKSMFVSMLNQRLQELTQQAHPPFLGAAVRFGSYARGYEGFSAYANAGTGDMKEALRAITEEIERVKRYGFTSGELQRAGKNLLAYYEQAYNNRDKTESADYVEEYINYFLQQEPSPGIAKEYAYVKELLPGITVDQVNALAKPLEGDVNRFVYVMGPEPAAGVSLPSDESLLATMSDAEKANVKPYEEKELNASLLNKVPVPGKVRSRKINVALGTTELTLSNGVTVTLKPTDFKNDQVLMSAQRLGGKTAYGLADKYNAEYCIQAVSAMGVGSFSPTDLRKALAGKNVGVMPNMGEVTEGLQGQTAVKDMETMFQLAYLYMTAPRKDTALFHSFVNRNQSQFAVLSANPQVAFIDTMFKTLYQNNPLAPVAVPHSEYFDQLDANRIIDIYKERFSNAYGMHFTLVGSFKEQEIMPLIEKYIASLPSKPYKVTYTDNKVRPVSGIKQLSFYKGKEQKSLILEFLNKEIPYSPELKLKATVLSDILNIRMIEELREKIQGIYGGGTSAEVEKLPYPHILFMVQLPCGPEKVDTLLNAVKAEFADMIAHGPEASYLEKVKKQLIEKYKVAVKENATWLQTLQQLHLQQGDPSYFLNYENYVNKLTAKDIQEAAKLILGSGNQFTAVLMPGKEEKTTEAKKGF